MATIRIEWLSDSHGCETCGTSYAEGARVFVDGKPVIELLPFADCFGGAHHDWPEVVDALLTHLGHTVESL